MWWRETSGRRRAAAIAGVIAAGLANAGCFQPVYGDRTVTGSNIRDAIAGVDVVPVATTLPAFEQRLAIELRDKLLFVTTGGGGALPPTHRLVIRISTKRDQVIVDTRTARSELENYGINATYQLIEIGPNKTVVSGSTFARVSYDVPGQEQRFARQRGLRDAENRAVGVLVEHLRTRLASYFVAKT
ncbi:MAG: hypothetical protein HY056_09135 [Proteobacteria bacterium]|nr:hypothetical protein [Pseudomonadota bacterium]